MTARPHRTLGSTLRSVLEPSRPGSERALERALTPQVRTHRTWSEAHAGTSLPAKVASLFPKEYDPAYLPDPEHGLSGITSTGSDIRRALSLYAGPGALVAFLLYALVGHAAEAAPFLLAVPLTLLLPLRTIFTQRAPAGSVRLEPESAALVARLDDLVRQAQGLVSSSGAGALELVTPDLVATLVAERARLVRALELVQDDLEDASSPQAHARAQSVLLRAVNAVADLAAALTDLRAEAALAPSSDTLSANALVDDLEGTARDLRARTRSVRAGLDELRSAPPVPTSRATSSDLA